MNNDSALIYLLSPTKRPDVRHLPMIRFDLIEQTIDFSRYDGLILTSKQGVAALDEISKGAWRVLPAAAIGKQTAEEIRKRGGEVIYTASKAYGDVLAAELIQKFPEKRWLYARPKVVVSKIAADLKSAGLFVDEAVVYETSCVRYTQKDAPRKGAVLIFTSPSIVQCFLRNFTWDRSWKAVAIGEKTARTFPKDIDVTIPEELSIDGAVDLARRLMA